MASLGREAFADEGSWLEHQANLARLLRPRVEQPKKRRKLTPHERKLRKKQGDAVWLILRGGREYRRAYHRVWKRTRYQTDPGYRARENQQCREYNKRRYATDPDWRRLRIALGVEARRIKRATDLEYAAIQNAKVVERRRIKRATDPEYRERENASQRIEGMSPERHQKRLAAKARYRARYKVELAQKQRYRAAAKKAAKLAAQSQSDHAA